MTRTTGSTPTYDNDELGGLAEQVFSLWAKEAHATAVPAFPDREGWDFHVTLPTARGAETIDPFAPPGSRRACCVQVKGTRGDRHRRGIALNRWLTAATMPLPWFIVAIEYDEPPRPARCFVIHVDPYWMLKLARRLWEEGAATDARDLEDHLHKLEMDATWTPSQALPCDAGAVFDAISAHIGADLHTYAERKRRWWEEAQAHDQVTAVRLIMECSQEHAYDEMARWALGLTRELHVPAFQRTTTRFGVERVGPVEDGEFVVTADFAPRLGDSMTITSAVGEQVTLATQVYSSSYLFPFLPPPHQKLRLAGRFIDLTLSKAETTVVVTAHIDPLEPATQLTALVATARAVRLLCGRCTLSFRFGSSEEVISIDWHGDTQTDVRGDSFDKLEVFEQAWRVLQQAGLPPDLEVRPGRVLGGADDVRFLDDLLASKATVHVRFKEWGADDTGDVEVAQLLVEHRVIDVHRVCVVAIVRGTPTPSGGSAVLRGPLCVAAVVPVHRLTTREGAGLPRSEA